MEKIAIILSLMFLSACSNGYYKANFPVVPPELSDCQFFILTNDKGGNITVVRCPNSTTTTLANKRTTVVVDGVEYEKVKDTIKSQDLIPQ